MGNREDISAGELCLGCLLDGAEGAVGFAGRASCPPGSQFANTQTPIEPATDPVIAVNPDTQSESVGPNSGAAGLVSNVIGMVLAFVLGG
ncbi:hypothetical protein [Endozoicomonas numazuensis]|nr:hypothetical protein [Endozoicomonas numazuensis]